jgi:hypothetical protein
MRDDLVMDPFESDEYESDNLTIKDVYDVVYTTIHKYYKNINNNFNVSLKNDVCKIWLEDDIICDISIDCHNMLCINFNNEKLDKYINLNINDSDRNRFSVFINFRKTMDNYLGMIDKT